MELELLIPPGMVLEIPGMLVLFFSHLSDLVVFHPEVGGVGNPGVLPG